MSRSTKLAKSVKAVDAGWALQWIICKRQISCYEVINAINDARGHKISFDELIHSFECADNAHCAPFSLVLHKIFFTFFFLFLKLKTRLILRQCDFTWKQCLQLLGRKVADQVEESLHRKSEKTQEVSKLFEVFCLAPILPSPCKCLSDTIVWVGEAVIPSHPSQTHFAPNFFKLRMTAAEKAKRQLLPARSWTCRCSCDPARRRWGCPWWSSPSSRGGLRPKPGRRESGWKEEPAANDRSTRRPSELLRPVPRHQLGLSFIRVRRSALLVSAAHQSCSKREFLVGNTFGQLVPRVFSHLCTLITMLTIYPVVHHVMKKASNCVYIPFIKRERRTSLGWQLSSSSMMGGKSYSVLLGAVIIAFVYTPWQSLCFPIQSSSTYLHTTV